MIKNLIVKIPFHLTQFNETWKADPLTAEALVTKGIDHIFFQGFL